MIRRSLFSAFLIVFTLASGFVAGRMSAAQPHMTAALQHLRQAKSSLERATPDKGGHRAKAMDLTIAAIAEVEQGIAFDRRH